MLLLSPLLKLDLFGASLPGFSLAGEEKVRTHIGGLVSFVIAYTTLLFGLLKLNHLLTKHNPQVN